MWLTIVNWEEQLELNLEAQYTMILSRIETDIKDKILYCKLQETCYRSLQEYHDQFMANMKVCEQLGIKSVYMTKVKAKWWSTSEIWRPETGCAK